MPLATRRRRASVIALLSLAFVGCGEGDRAHAPNSKVTHFVRVEDGRFVRGDRPYAFLGANYWQGMHLGMAQGPGDRARLRRELDQLKALGITNLRILGASEGPDDAPWRVVPSLQTAPGRYREAVFEGLDYLLAEMRRRDMTAVVMLGNFWPWSGGMAQYLQWHGAGDIPYPPPAVAGDWTRYQRYTARFYAHDGARRAYRAHIRALVTRTNSLTGVAYRDDPTILSWQLANEPRAMDQVDAFEAWVGDAAAFIRSLDPHHLVSTGTEGDTPWPDWHGMDFARTHAHDAVDYATIHIWAVNWGWYDPAAPDRDLEAAIAKMRDYLVSHAARAAALGKPLVIEEFGMGRDGGGHDPATTVTDRARYFEALYAAVRDAVRQGLPVTGTNFWSWAGEGRPRTPPGGLWRPGDPLIGDPPHEHQGWNSVYGDEDATLDVLRRWADRVTPPGAR